MFQILLLFFVISSVDAQNTVCFDIEENPYPNDSALSCFSKYVNVLDCFSIYAESSVQDEKVLHAAAVAAELLDNDEDGIVDNPEIFHILQSQDALMPIFTSEWSSCLDSFEQNYSGDGVSAILFRNEMDPSQPGYWGADASVEEIIHTINHVAHVELYPEIFGIQPNSSIMSDAMDLARGGQFLSVPNQYPEHAWYHYDDWTCDYECMAIEYLYWCIVSYMGILDDIQTCNGIANEWELCSPELFEQTDIVMHQVVSNLENNLPQFAPDGNYCSNNIIGDLNEDGIVNVLDVISVINMIFDTNLINESADINADGVVNILDVIGIVNIILGNEINQI